MIGQIADKPDLRERRRAQIERRGLGAAIRHGFARRQALLIMPAGEFIISATPTRAVIAYIKSLPPVDNEFPAMRKTLFRVAMTFMDVILPAEVIDHTAPRQSPRSGRHGRGCEYSLTCTGCHGPGFSGGPIPLAPPEFPPALNLTPGGELQGWTEEMFINTMRTGVTPSGHQFKTEYMPWKQIGQMTDDELKAILLFLRSLPAPEQGNR